MEHLKRTWVEINLDNLAHNYRTMRKLAGEKVKFLGVVKADAYGHGAIIIAKELVELGADYLAVSSVDEALELRAGGIDAPILVFGHTPADQVEKLIKYNITQTVTCKAKALEYEAEAERLGGNLKVHIKLDTGMSRLGFLCHGTHFESCVESVLHCCNLPHLIPEGIYTHFAVSDEYGSEDVEYTRAQFALFKRMIDTLAQRGRSFELCHCANSGAFANYPETCLDMVRPGLITYGYGECAKKLGLLPVMSEKTVISTIKVLDEDTGISYGRLYKTKKPTRVGVLPIGYADGFMRSLSDKYEVMTSYGKAKVLGRICMDMCMIDLSEYPQSEVGDEIEIFGKISTIEEMAECAHTIPYEITCAVSRRVPRVYIKNGKVIHRELRLETKK